MAYRGGGGSFVLSDRGQWRNAFLAWCGAYKQGGGGGGGVGDRRYCLQRSPRAWRQWTRKIRIEGGKWNGLGMRTRLGVQLISWGLVNRGSFVGQALLFFLFFLGQVLFEVGNKIMGLIGFFKKRVSGLAIGVKWTVFNGIQVRQTSCYLGLKQ